MSKDKPFKPNIIRDGLLAFAVFGIILAIGWALEVSTPIPANASSNDSIDTPNIPFEKFTVNGYQYTVFTKEYKGKNYTCFRGNYELSCSLVIP